MNTSHTPGPWITSAMYGLQNEHEYLIWANDAAVAHVFQRSETADPAATQTANARLIASAPDLLLALIELEKVESSPHSETVRFLAREQARAAIARATGN